MNWLKKIVLSYALSIVNSQLEDFCKRNPAEGVQIEIFRNNLYKMSINDFMSWSLDLLSKKDLKKVTFPEYLKNIVTPMNDGVEDILVKVIDEMGPK